jgi:hypothetical protein
LVGSVRDFSVLAKFGVPALNPLLGGFAFGSNSSFLANGFNRGCRKGHTFLFQDLGDGPRAFTAEGLVANHHPRVTEVVYEAFSSKPGNHGLSLCEVYAFSTVKVVDELFLAAFSTPQAANRALPGSGFGAIRSARQGGFWLEFAAHRGSAYFSSAVRE